ncbi:MAG: hypothetical protein MUF23_08840 [Pirellula sp.]|nr:hypothetical protein [Pirellula sp.]
MLSRLSKNRMHPPKPSNELMPCSLWVTLIVTCLYSTASFGQMPLPSSVRRVCIAEFAQEISGTFPTISLSNDGNEILVLRSKGQVSLFGTDDLVESSISVNPRCIGVVTDPQQGGVLSILGGRDRKVSKGHRRNLSELEFYNDLDAFQKQQIAWRLNDIDTEFLDVSRIHGTQLTSVIDCSFTRSQFQSTIRIIDEFGQIAFRCELQGSVIGIEPSEDPSQLDVYFASSRNDESVILIKRALIDLNAMKPSLVRIQPLFQLPLREGDLLNAKFAFSRRGPFSGRSLRMRGSRAGDVHYFVTEILAKKGYLSPIEYSIDGVPGHETMMLPRLRNLNVVASDQEPASYELLTHWGVGIYSHLHPLQAIWKNSKIFLRTTWNRNGQEAYLSAGQLNQNIFHFAITDGIQLPDGVIATATAGHNALDRGPNEIPLQELIVLDIGQRAEKYRGK